MPPRYAYWTILAGGLPTAFRAADRDDLLPTFQRIREKHPDAQMKWFARGRLWASPEDAQQERERDRRRTAPLEGSRKQGRWPQGDRDRAGGHREAKGRDWRPGGEHRDPRQKYKDARKQKNLDRRNERFARKHGDERARPRSLEPRERGQGRAPRGKPHGDTLRQKVGGPERGSRRERPPSGSDRDRRLFERKQFDRGPARRPQRERWRAQGTEEPPQPPRPRGPNREPRPSEEPPPQAPPRPSEPQIPPPGPPERGRPNPKRKTRRRG
jgi:hypothetical protein